SALRLCSFFIFQCSAAPLYFPSFPTRRSSDLRRQGLRVRPVLFQGHQRHRFVAASGSRHAHALHCHRDVAEAAGGEGHPSQACRSEEHTSELQSLTNLVCRLLLEKKKTRLLAIDHRHQVGLIRWAVMIAWTLELDHHDELLYLILAHNSLLGCSYQFLNTNT